LARQADSNWQTRDRIRHPPELQATALRDIADHPVLLQFRPPQLQSTGRVLVGEWTRLAHYGFLAITIVTFVTYDLYDRNCIVVSCNERYTRVT